MSWWRSATGALSPYLLACSLDESVRRYMQTALNMVSRVASKGHANTDGLLGQRCFRDWLERLIGETISVTFCIKLSDALRNTVAVLAERSAVVPEICLARKKHRLKWWTARPGGI